MPRTLIIVPTYNEIENIAGLIAELRSAVPAASILIVDDASPDGTGVLADSISTRDAAVTVMHRPGKSGLGAAYRAAYTWALDHGMETIVQMDADGSHRAADLPALLTASAHSDVVLGSRWVAGGGVVNWPVRRIALSRGGSAYARVALALPFSDITGGFRVFSADAIRRMDAASLHSQGYCYQIEMLMRAHDVGLSIAEVPITFIERTAGESKMSGAIVREAMLEVTRWGWRRRRAISTSASTRVSTSASTSVSTSAPSRPSALLTPLLRRRATPRRGVHRLTN